MVAPRKVACIYDFDLTLSEEYQQFPIFREFAAGIRQKHGITAIEDYFTTLCSGQGIDIGVGAMQQVLLDAKDIFPDLTNERLRTIYGPQIRLASGLPDWFARTTTYGEQRGLQIQHHVISAGFTPLIEGTSIAPYLASIRSGTFIEGQAGIERIKTIVDPNNKREEIIKICKGGDVHKDLSIDEYEFTYENVIVFGDGKSDRRKFNFIRERGGIAVGVYTQNDSAHFLRAREDLHGLVHYLVPRNYSSGSSLERVVQQSLDTIAQRSCTFDFRMVHSLQLNHLRHAELEAVTQKHVDSCNDCQERSQGTQIVE